jgi:hypothetical protein
MSFYLRLITAADTPAFSATPCASVEAAMTSACAALRYGAKDAWVENENGDKFADFEAIKKHCGIREDKN